MAVHMRNGIQYGGIPNGTVKGTTPSTVPTTVKQLNQIGTVGDIAPVTIPSAVKFSNGNTLETAIGSVATIETSPAVATHAIGDYVFYNGQMYKVIAAIAVGETLTVDTNIEATSVGEELTTLNNGLTPEIVKVTSDLISGDITFIKSGKVVTVNFFNDTKAAVPAWGESKLCAIPNGMLPAFDNEWNHGTITIQDGITTILVAYVDGIYVENKTSQTIGRGSWISGRLTYICE